MSVSNDVPDDEEATILAGAEALARAKGILQDRGKYTFWLTPVFGFPAAMLEKIKDCPAGWKSMVWMSEGGNVAALAMAVSGKRILCFNVDWS